MSGAGLIELLAARLGGRGVRRASPSLREALVDLSARSAEPGVAGQEEALRQAYGRLSMEMPTENLRLPTSRVSLDDLPDVGPGWRDKDKVAHYADLLAQSEPPPIMIARDARNGAWDVIDGNHRLEVMRAAGRREIPAMDATGAFKGRYVSSDAMPPKAAPRRTGPDAGPVQGENAPRRMADGTVALDQYMPNHGEWTEPMETALRREVQANRFVEQEVPITDLTTTQQSVFPHFAQTIDNRGGHGLPIVYRTQDGRLLLVDGHHRAAANAASGNGSLRVRVYSEPARTAPDGRPVQAGRIPSSMRIEIQQPPGQSGSRYRLELDNQKNGFITVTDDGDVWRVNNSHLDPDLRNQGHGVRLYEDLVLRAREAGARTLRSDNSVSTEAQNAWMGLQRRGYPVTRIETPDGPRFEVDLARTGPDGGPVQAGNRPEVEVRRLDSGTYEARVDGKRVGGIVIDQRSDAPHVFNVNVDPEFRRQGVATALYQAAERDLGRPLAPSASQSDDALAFWNNYRPEAVADDLRAHKNALIGQTVETRYGPAVIENVVSHQAVGRLASGGTTAVSRTQLEPLLARTGPNGGPVQAGRGAERITMYGPDETGAYTVEATVDGKLVGRTDLFPHEGGFAPEGGQVIPAFQRQGVMSRILQHAEQEIGASLRRPMGMTDEGRAMWEQYASRRTAPNAGSDRNALQRALRERMNRE